MGTFKACTALYNVSTTQYYWITIHLSLGCGGEDNRLNSPRNSQNNFLVFQGKYLHDATLNVKKMETSHSKLHVQELLRMHRFI